VREFLAMGRLFGGRRYRGGRWYRGPVSRGRAGTPIAGGSASSSACSRAAPGAAHGMTRKRRRLYAVLAGMTMLGAAAFLVLSAFNDNLVFFYSPTDLKTKAVPLERQLRIAASSRSTVFARAADGKTITFASRWAPYTVVVTYTGGLPDLFREGQGVVAEGMMQRDGRLPRRHVLAKHDENYMPPGKVAECAEKSGHWQEDARTRRCAMIVELGHYALFSPSSWLLQASLPLIGAARGHRASLMALATIRR